MPSGDWCKGKTKETDKRIADMAKNVSNALRDPELRKRLDKKKRLNRDQILERISKAKSRWSVISGIDDYDKQILKTFFCTCPENHITKLSLMDIILNVRCKTCEPRKNVGAKNHAYKNLSKFTKLLIDKFGCDTFEFDAQAYHGMFRAIDFRCLNCGTTFNKPPREILGQKYGCATCAKVCRGDSQRRTYEEFITEARKIHGDRYTYHPKLNQSYGNGERIERTCKLCNVIDDQSIASLLHGNGCSTCSEKKKHTTESFIVKSKKIWGDDLFDYSLVNYVHNKIPVTLTCNKGHTFQTIPSNHFIKRGCPSCVSRKFISAGETEWLNSLNIPEENRNIWIKIDCQRFNVDALINSTIYEYYGDFWHGNLKRFKENDINVYKDMTMKELYEHTMTREQALKDAGYVVITMWESDWLSIRKNKSRH